MNIPADLKLEGRIVTLRRLEPDRDGPELFEATPPETFRWFLRWPDPWNQDTFIAYLRNMAATARWHPLVVIEQATGRIVGSSSLLDVDPAHRALEIGSTWYTPAVRGTGVNPECKLLMMKYAFQTLGCIRVTLKTDARNAHSRAAILKLGATYEGTLRSHRIRQIGEPRDSVMFSVLESEWPRVREGLERRVLSALGRASG